MRRLSESRGATLVELALILPLFMLPIMGTIDMGRYMAATASVNTAAREAARYGSSVGLNASSVDLVTVECFDGSKLRIAATHPVSTFMPLLLPETFTLSAEVVTDIFQIGVTCPVP